MSLIDAIKAIEDNIPTTINLNSTQIDNEGAKELALALKSNTTLTSIDLNDNQIGVEGAQALAQALSAKTALTSIILNDNQIGDIGAQALAQALSANTSLTSIDLQGNLIGDIGAQALAKALISNTSLTSIDLMENQIGDKGAQALAKALTSNTSLNSINLNANKIGDIGAQELAQGLKSNTSLTSINLNFNYINILKEKIYTIVKINNSQEKFKDIKKLSLLCRDLDDSSDEEELEDKSVAIDYNMAFNEDKIKIDEFANQSNIKVDESVNQDQIKVDESVYTTHILANRLLYSKEVNQVYYPKKQQELVNDERFLDTIKNSIKHATMPLVEKYWCNNNGNLSKETINHIIEEVLEKLNINVESLETLSGLNFTKRTDLLENIEIIIFKKYLTLFKNSLINYFKEKEYRYREPSPDNEIKNSDYPKQNFNINFAIDLIKERLKEGRYRPAKNAKIVDYSENTIYPNLRDKTWEFVSIARGGTMANNAINNIATKQQIQEAYIQDLIKLVQKDNSEDILSDAWQLTLSASNPKNFWLLDYLHLSDTRFNNLIIYYFDKALKEQMTLFFYKERPTLPNTYMFSSDKTVDFLANLRLANRSIRRMTKNLSGNDLANALFVEQNPRVTQFQWSFFSKANAALEFQSIHANSKTRQTKIDNANTYQMINKEINAIKAYLNISDMDIARWLRQMIIGAFKIDKTQFNSKEDRSIISERFTVLAYLLFGCEVTRNPASLIIHQMMLDLIIAGKLSWKDAFCGGKNTKIPMSISEDGDNIKQARQLNTIFSNTKNQLFPYKFDNSRKSTTNPTALLNAEARLIKQWLKNEGINNNIDSNNIAKAICKKFDEWFGIGVFDINNFTTAKVDNLAVDNNVTRNTSQPS